MPEQAHKRRRVRWWMIALALLLLLLVYLTYPRPVPVRAAPARRGVLRLALSSTAVVEGRVSDVSSNITARIISLPLREGDAVSRGQVLAQLDTRDLRAAVASREAAVTAAEQQAAALQRAVAAETRQFRADVDRARANLQAAQANLGQVTAGTRTEDIAAQEAVVEQARAQAASAQREYERMERLYQEGAVSQRQRDLARTESQTAAAQLEAQQQTLRRLEAGARPQEITASQAQVRIAEAALRQAQANRGTIAARRHEVEAAQANVAQARAGLQSARAQLADATIRSPLSGVVARKYREVGEIASSFEPIYSIANLSDIWITAEVDAEDVAAVAPGQTVEITLDAYPGRRAIGRVARVARVAEPKEVGRVRAKVVRTRIEVVSSDLPLRPGMEVTVTGSLPTGSATVLAPNDAILRVGERDHVYVIRNGVARLRPVVIGQSNFEETQILSGLAAGEMVAISNLDGLSDGTRVKVVP
ncbi:MAG: efflux RND transporter periplasmic adaptor subunit [Armatimonadota bacterium]